MKSMRVLMAAMLAGMVMVPALAQDSKEAPAKDAKKTSSEKKADVGDKSAMKMLKKAWERVHSAKADGLERLKADADIEADVSAMGMGELAFGGHLIWSKEKGGDWISDEDEGAEGNSNPLGNMSGAAKGVFQQFLPYVMGFDAWDDHFKEAKFAFKEIEKSEKKEGDKEAEAVKGKLIVVTMKKDDKEVKETYNVHEGKIVFVKRKQDFQGQMADATVSYEYEDKGKKLRINKITVKTELDVSGMPGQNDPKNPGANPGPEAVESSTTISKYIKAGDTEIAAELETTFKIMGMEIPLSLNITNPKANKEVSDDDLKELEGESAGGSDEPEGAGDDEDF